MHSASNASWAIVARDGSVFFISTPDQSVLVGAGFDDETPVRVACTTRNVLALCSSGVVYTAKIPRCTEAALPRRVSFGILPHNVLTAQRVVEVSCGANHSLALSDGGLVYAWGENEHGQLGLGHHSSIDIPTLLIDLVRDEQKLRPKQLASGTGHSLALTHSGAVFSWGLGTDGQLGHGKFESECVPVRVPLTTTGTVAAVVAGDYHSAALVSECVVRLELRRVAHVTPHTLQASEQAECYVHRAEHATTRTSQNEVRTRKRDSAE